MTATPGQPPDLYARWYRIDAANATDDDVASAWRMTFPADREFWTGLEAAQAALSQAHEQQRLQLLQAQRAAEEAAAEIVKLKAQHKELLDMFHGTDSGHSLRLSGVRLTRMYASAEIPVPDRLSHLEGQ